jgi:hypothetical protein
MSAHDRMLELIANLRDAASVEGAIISEVSATVEKIIEEIPVKQTGLAGSRWEPGKKRSNVLMNVAAGTSVSASGSKITITLGEPYVWHQWGAGGNPVREILPSAGLPQTLGNAIANSVVLVSEEWLNRPGSHRRRLHKGKSKRVKK